MKFTRRRRRNKKRNRLTKRSRTLQKGRISKKLIRSNNRKKQTRRRRKKIFKGGAAALTQSPRDHVGKWVEIRPVGDKSYKAFIGNFVKKWTRGDSKHIIIKRNDQPGIDLNEKIILKRSKWLGIREVGEKFKLIDEVEAGVLNDAWLKAKDDAPTQAGDELNRRIGEIEKKFNMGIAALKLVDSSLADEAVIKRNELLDDLESFTYTPHTAEERHEGEAGGYANYAWNKFTLVSREYYALLDNKKDLKEIISAINQQKYGIIGDNQSILRELAKNSMELASNIIEWVKRENQNSYAAGERERTRLALIRLQRTPEWMQETESSSVNVEKKKELEVGEVE